MLGVRGSVVTHLADGLAEALASVPAAFALDGGVKSLGVLVRGFLLKVEKTVRTTQGLSPNS